MNTPLLSEALNESIDRLANGQSIEQCLRPYPELADELRPLLQIGQASSINRADLREMSLMRSRLDAQIDTLITKTDFSSPTPFRLPQGIMVLIASLILVVIGGLVLFSGGDINVGGEGTETPTLTPEITVEVTATVTEAPSETPSPVPIQIVIDDDSPTSECILPDGWQEYHVRSGDLLSKIALNSGSSTEELIAINCLEESGFIVEGQLLFVPHLWQVNTQAENNNGLNSGSLDSSLQQLDDDDHSDDDDDDDSDDNDRGINNRDDDSDDD